MTALIKALVTLLKGNTGVALFLGIGPDGQKGPFWGVAPERTAFPFTVLSQVPGGANQYQFGASGAYIAPITVQISIFDNTVEGVSAKAETLANLVDFTSSLSLENNEKCRRPRRLEEPRIIPADIDGTGQRGYQAILQYLFNVQRTVGT